MNNFAISAATFAIPTQSEQSTVSWINNDQGLEYLTVNDPGHGSLLSDRPEWEDAEYRQGYMEAAIEQGVAWQIRANRNARGWSQSDLATRIETGQSGVSRLEDPEYGCHSLQQLIKVANAFDCALLVKFVPYSTLAKESQDLSPAALFAAPYSNETPTEGHHA